MLAIANALRQYHAPSVGGWFSDALGAWESKGAASYAASKLDLSGNGNDLSEGNSAVTWDATNGWQFTAAASKFLYAAGVTFTGGAYTIMIQFAAVTDGGSLCGLNDSGAGYSLYITPNQFSNRVRYVFAATTEVVPQLTAGNLAIAGTDVYRDGVDEGNITQEAGSTTAPFGIGGVTRSSTPTGDNYISANIYAAAVCSSILSAVDVAAKAAAMAAL